LVLASLATNICQPQRAISSEISQALPLPLSSRERHTRAEKNERQEMLDRLAFNIFSATCISSGDNRSQQPLPRRRSREEQEQGASSNAQGVCVRVATQHRSLVASVGSTVRQPRFEPVFHSCPRACCTPLPRCRRPTAAKYTAALVGSRVPSLVWPEYLRYAHCLEAILAPPPGCGSKQYEHRN